MTPEAASTVSRESPSGRDEYHFPYSARAASLRRPSASRVPEARSFSLTPCARDNQQWLQDEGTHFFPGRRYLRGAVRPPGAVPRLKPPPSAVGAGAGAAEKPDAAADAPPKLGAGAVGAVGPAPKVGAGAGAEDPAAPKAKLGAGAGAAPKAGAAGVAAPNVGAAADVELPKLKEGADPVGAPKTGADAGAGFAVLVGAPNTEGPAPAAAGAAERPKTGGAAGGAVDGAAAPNGAVDGGRVDAVPNAATGSMEAAAGAGACITAGAGAATAGGAALAVVGCCCCWA